MSETIKVTEAELRELLEGATEVDSDYWRHGRRVRYVVERDEAESVQRHWLTGYLDQHTEEGIQIYGDDNTLTLAEQVEVMTKVWREVQ